MREIFGEETTDGKKENMQRGGDLVRSHLENAIQHR